MPSWSKTQINTSQGLDDLFYICEKTQSSQHWYGATELQNKLPLQYLLQLTDKNHHKLKTVQCSILPDGKDWGQQKISVSSSEGKIACSVEGAYKALLAYINCRWKLHIWHLKNGWVFRLILWLSHLPHPLWKSWIRHCCI